MTQIIVSACLAGTNCKYNGGNNYHPQIAKLLEEGIALPICPEVWGGLPTPRPPSEIIATDGHRVLAGSGKVLTIDGTDVTEQFLLGAKKVLAYAQENNVTMAILKERSPSCGVNFIYDGTFHNARKPGQGVLAALLKQHGFTLYTEEDTFAEVLKHLQTSLECE